MSDGLTRKIFGATVNALSPLFSPSLHFFPISSLCQNASLAESYQTRRHKVPWKIHTLEWSTPSISLFPLPSGKSSALTVCCHKGPIRCGQVRSQGANWTFPPYPGKNWFFDEQYTPKNGLKSRFCLPFLDLPPPLSWNPSSNPGCGGKCRKKYLYIFNKDTSWKELENDSDLTKLNEKCSLVSVCLLLYLSVRDPDLERVIF